MPATGAGILVRTEILIYRIVTGAGIGGTTVGPWLGTPIDAVGRGAGAPFAIGAGAGPP